MFLAKQKEKVTTIDGFELKFKYPTILDEFQFEAKRTTLSRGQYPTMALSPIESQRKILDLIDAVAELTICVIFLNNEKNGYYWEGFSDEDGKEFILKVWNEWNEWRLSFRNGDKTSSKE